MTKPDSADPEGSAFVPPETLRRMGLPEDLLLPSTYAEFLKQRPDGYELYACHSVTLITNPAHPHLAVIGSTGVPFITTRLAQAVRAWRLLPPKRSAIFADLMMVNQKIGVGYQYRRDPDSQKSIIPHRVFGLEEGWDLIRSKTNLFSWPSNVSADPLSDEEFEQQIRKSRQHMLLAP